MALRRPPAASRAAVRQRRRSDRRQQATRSGSPIRPRTPSTRAPCRPSTAVGSDGASPSARQARRRHSDRRPDPDRPEQADDARQRLRRRAPATWPASPPTRSASRPSTTAGCSAPPSSPGTRVQGVPLRVAVYARGNSTPVLALTATNISYGAVAASDFAITPPAGAKVVQVSTADQAGRAGARARPAARAKAHREASGVAAVAKPRAVQAGRAEQAGRAAAADRQAAGLGRQAGGAGHLRPEPRRHRGDRAARPTRRRRQAGRSANRARAAAARGLSLPTVSINGATGQELDTALGTVLRFSRGGVAYTVLGSVPAAAANRRRTAMSHGPAQRGA